ncbi:cytochrome-c oxidase, cbb3-type subunit III [Alphaproteobacteria bacterium GH1-50]|uniref:Cbb3-type cytochrome c oxidase subunit n=1 Tax=Kangsaoukella pontilimi TaxID=2691042 RepID=A0A7C9MCI4_9RHOB|nr:cytochrome-c oxidase, cbb3-type subunit III [Kangsaoukella pontilimi]MXQ09453.1 cytochrome-c oxidase, cbb3-type subunit III [Kangsaoukella pontilimi]
MSQNDDDQKTNELGYGTTGHSWDGIEEWNNPMPKWWVWTFWATVVWGILYTIAYPAWPLIERATPGILGQSTRADVAADIAAVNERNASLNEALAGIDLTTLADDADLHGYAVNKGRSVFLNNCSQCHGAGAAGVQAAGYPNLLDDAWLWGGQIDEIAYTVSHGIRNEQSLDARWSEMPAFGEILGEEEIAGVVQYVRQISGQEHEAALAAAGAETFLNECASCHGEQGMGDQSLGAPNLTDAIWLYGGSVETLTETVVNARFGVMPAWNEEFRGANGLTDAEINAVAAYVHQLGGGQ